MFDKGNELGTLFAYTLFSIFDLFQPILRRLNWRVWCIVSKIQEERLFRSGSLFDVLYRPLGKQVCCMTFGVDLHLVYPDVVDSVTAMLIIIVHHVTKVAVEVVEAALVGSVR